VRRFDNSAWNRRQGEDMPRFRKLSNPATITCECATWLRRCHWFDYSKFDRKIGPRGERIMTVGFGWMHSYEKQITGITRFANVAAGKR